MGLPGIGRARLLPSRAPAKNGQRNADADASGSAGASPSRSQGTPKLSMDNALGDRFVNPTPVPRSGIRQNSEFLLGAATEFWRIPLRGTGHELLNQSSSALSRLNFGVANGREGEAPAEPEASASAFHNTFFGGAWLGRSLALPIAGNPKTKHGQRTSHHMTVTPRHR